MPKTKAKTLRVSFGGPTRNEKSRNLVVKMSRSVGLTPDEVDELVTGARVDVTLSCDPNDQSDTDGQEVMDHAEPAIESLSISADVIGFRVSEKEFSFSLSLPLDGVDAEHLDKFAFKSGKLKIARTGDRIKDKKEAA